MSDEMSEEPTLEVRDAQPEDRDAVFAFCSRTWGDDGDYIPDVWDSWLADPDGAVLVGIMNGRPVALSRINMIAPEEAWIEGLRVAPDMRRQGVGRIIVSRSLVRARELGAFVARMFTGATNTASQRLFTRYGFTRIAELAWYTGDALPGDPEEAARVTQPRTAAELDPSISETTRDTTVGALPTGARLRTPGPAEFDRLWAWLEQSNLTPFNGGIEIHHWAGRGVTEPVLREYLAAGNIIELEEWSATQALAIVTEDEDHAGLPELEIRYIDGLSDAIGRLALLLRGEAARRELKRVWLWLPDLLILRDAMNGAGYLRGDEVPMWAYAREL